MRYAFITALLLLLVPQTLPAAGYTKNVAIVVFNGVEILDLAAPAEIFAMAGQIAAQNGERAFHVYTVGSSKTPVASQGFLDVVADYTVADAPRPDLLVLPGGRADNAINDAALMAWMKTAAGGAENVLTICYGSFIAGRLGLVDGQDITTWYGSVDRLGAEFPNARARAGRRFLDNGKLITSAGVSAGLDASMHFVAKTLGRYVADRTAEYMEYPWAPQAYTSAVYPQLNPRLDAHGRRLQEASIAQRGGDVAGALAIYRELVAANAADAEAWLNLGTLALTAKQYPDAIRALTRAADAPAQRTNALYDLACAYAVTGERDRAFDAIERAVKNGFTQKAFLANDPDLASLRDDARFQRLLDSL